MYLLLGSKHHVSKLIQLNFFLLFLSRRCMEIYIFINHFEMHSGNCWEIKANVSAFFKKIFSIDIDRKKHFSVSIVSFIAMFILFLTTRYLLRGPESLTVKINFFPHYGAHAYFDPICSAYSVLIYFFERNGKK